MSSAWLNDIKRDFQDDIRLNFEISASLMNRPAQEMPGQFGDFGIGQAGIRFADRFQLAPTTTQSRVASAFFNFNQASPLRPGE